MREISDALFESILSLAGLQDIHRPLLQDLASPSPPLPALTIDEVTPTELPGGLNALIQPSHLGQQRPRSLGDLLQQAKADAHATPRRPADAAPPLVVRSLALTPAVRTTLEPLIAQASAPIGRKASAPAVVRALSAWAEQEHLGTELARQMAAELQTGEVMWGKAKQRREIDAFINLDSRRLHLASALFRYEGIKHGEDER